MEKPMRPQRNRRHSRRAWPPEDDLHRPRAAKRLFTPEIKRMLKDWLIRRRENPYPSRDEKKRLAVDTQLTYTQICNWFANWRRKLKNSERERQKKSWGHLIKNYNTNAKGNVEQFSISSEDSIWEEELRPYNDDDDDIDSASSGAGSLMAAAQQHNANERKYYKAVCKPNSNCYVEAVQLGHSNYYASGGGGGACPAYAPTTAQCYQISSTTTPNQDASRRIVQNGGNLNLNLSEKTFTSNNKAKYKQQIMEKYLRDTTTTSTTPHELLLAPGGEHVGMVEQLVRPPTSTTPTDAPPAGGGAALSKWLESAAKFTPDKNNYFIEWNNRRKKLDRKQARPKQLLYRSPHLTSQLATPMPPPHIYETIHHKDELNAAEALANLAYNCRQRLQQATTTAPMNAISS